MFVTSVPQTALALVAGSLSTLSPCVLPLLPLVVGGSLQGHRFGPLAMGAGMTLSFAIVGIGLGALGPKLGLDADSVRNFGAWLLLAFALVMLVPRLGDAFSRWMLPLANRAQQASARWDGRTLASAAALGAVLGLVWSPCSGPLLGSALSLVASEDGLARGGTVLGAFGFGAALPLMVLAYLSRQRFILTRDWLLARVQRAQCVFALVLGGLGLAVLTGGDKWLEAQVVQILPDRWITFTSGI